MTTSAAQVVPCLLALTVTGCSHLWVYRPYDDRETEHGRVVVREGIAVAEVEGTPDQIGAALGRLFAGEIEDLSDGILGGLELEDADVAALEEGLAGALSPDHAAEIRALADASGVPFHRILVASVIPDFACTALAAWGSATRSGELLIGRNMDFPPANLLGSHTVVLVSRPTGKRAFVSIGWPGFGGVVSGFNDRGVAAFILVNFGSRGAREEGGEPLAFRVRRVLEEAADLDEAIAILTSAPVLSNHYVLLADPRSAILAYQFADEFRFVRPEGKILVASNEDVEDDGLFFSEDGYGIQVDERANCLFRLASDRAGRIDEETLGAIVGASYLRYINAQSMIVAPDRRTLQLALGTTLAAASHCDWVELELGPILEGRSVDTVAARVLDDPDESFDHYTDADYPEDPERRTARRRARIQAATRLPDLEERLEIMLETAEKLEESPETSRWALGIILGEIEKFARLSDQNPDPRSARALRRFVENTLSTFEEHLEPPDLQRIESVRSRPSFPQ